MIIMGLKRVFKNYFNILLCVAWSLVVKPAIIFPQWIKKTAAALENGQYSVIWDGMKLPIVLGGFS